MVERLEELLVKTLNRNLLLHQVWLILVLVVFGLSWISCDLRRRNRIDLDCEIDAGWIWDLVGRKLVFCSMEVWWSKLKEAVDDVM